MMKHAAFHRGYIWAALALALFVGFAVGAHLTFILGFGFLPSPGFASFIQLHGHTQLVGWAGLSIMGISLHVLPRLAGVPVVWPQGLNWLLWCMTGGLILRALTQSVLPYLTNPGWFGAISGLAVASGGLELCGTTLYVGLVLPTLRQAGRRQPRSALRTVRPYVLIMLLGWCVYACLNLALLVAMARQRHVILPVAWHHIAIECFIGLVLLPVAFVFSRRFFPLYLRLPPPHGVGRGLAYVYLTSWLVQILPTIATLQRLAPQSSLVFFQIGRSFKAGVILWVVWHLQVFRHQRPAATEMACGPGPLGWQADRAFGPFASLIYSAYVWLMLAACSDMVAGSAGLFGYADVINAGAIRHLYVFGFITLLIFGVSVRMIPGFVGQKRIARPGLVTATLWLGNTAVFCRILLPGAPPVLWQTFPGGVPGAQVAFALSGILGLAAVGCLSANLWQTARQT